MDEFIVFNGGTKSNKHEFGTNTVNINLVGQLVNFEPVNQRVTSLRIRGKRYNHTLISDHAPTEDKEEIIKDNFYDQLYLGNHSSRTIKR